MTNENVQLNPNDKATSHLQMLVLAGYSVMRQLQQLIKRYNGNSPLPETKKNKYFFFKFCPVEFDLPQCGTISLTL